jgi:hypothetical protein
MSIGSSVTVILICGFTAILLAQAPPELPKPGPEHKKLESFLGTWKVESEIKANGYVPAGKGVTTETYTLGPGGFWVERRAEGQIPETFGIMAYDSYAKAYVSYYASSVGLVGTGTGSVNGKWGYVLECAGINRHGVGDERALRVRASDPLDPEFCASPTAR